MVIPGSIVKVHYNDFDGVSRVGLFLVVYTEQLDSNTQYSGNFLACKLTTQMSQIPNYSFPLSSLELKFLEKDCMVTCSKLHTFSMSQVDKQCGLIGQLPYVTMLKVYKVFKNFERTLDRQLETAI